MITPAAMLAPLESRTIVGTLSRGLGPKVGVLVDNVRNVDTAAARFSSLDDARAAAMRTANATAHGIQNEGGEYRLWQLREATVFDNLFRLDGDGYTTGTLKLPHGFEPGDLHIRRPDIVEVVDNTPRYEPPIVWQNPLAS